MGETEYWDEFRGHDNETGEVLSSPQSGVTIMFGESWDVDISFMNNITNSIGLSDVGVRSFRNGTFDINQSQLFLHAGQQLEKC